MAESTVAVYAAIAGNVPITVTKFVEQDRLLDECAASR